MAKSPDRISGTGWARLAAAVIGMSLFLAACEDQGNPGDDNLLTGASLIVVLLIAGVIALMIARRRRG